MDTQQAEQTPPKYLKKTLDAIKLVEAGISPRDALQATNMVTKISAQAVSKFKAKLRKYSLTQPQTVHLASTQIKRILKAHAREEAHKKVTKSGEVVEYIDNVYPTDTNILAAAAMVYDRLEPAKTISQNLNINIDASPVDLSRWMDNEKVNCQSPVDKPVDI